MASAVSCGRIGRVLPIEALGTIPSVAVFRAVDAFIWARIHGRDPKESMLRARVAFRMASPDHGRSLGQAFHGVRNTRCLILFESALGPVLTEAIPKGTVPSLAVVTSMRPALELDMALGVEEAAEERRHAKARDGR